MEHASIAAFARFTLQLLECGAPSELVMASNQAIADETHHARMCFELATQYAGAPVGPGALPMTGALDESDLTSVVLGTILEGCVGETIAALEAAEAREHCIDSSVKAVLSTIHKDELRHAELAWRFLQWSLGRGNTEIASAVEGAFAKLRTEVAQPLPALTKQEQARGQALLRAGVVPPAMAPEIRRRALVEVVLPCAQQLLRDDAPRRAA